MGKSCIFFLPTIVCMAGGLTVNSARSDEMDYAIAGIGATSCATYTAKIQSDAGATDVFLDWSQGFLSGINTGEIRAKKRTTFVALPDRRIIKTFVDGYCKELPERSTSKALIDLFDTFAANPTSS